MEKKKCETNCGRYSNQQSWKTDEAKRYCQTCLVFRSFAFGWERELNRLAEDRNVPLQVVVSFIVTAKAKRIPSKKFTGTCQVANDFSGPCGCSRPCAKHDLHETL